MDAVLEKIKEFADKAHGTQMRKYTPERYIVHPVRVMELCREYTSDESVLASALLHDVLEDTPVKADEIRQFLVPLMGAQKAERTVSLVIELTDIYVKESYPQWNRRKRKQAEKERMAQTSPESQTVKYADILDNCMEIVTHDPSFAKVFLKECRDLLTVLRKGDPELYQRALHGIDINLEALKRKHVNNNAK
jgi:(p)ppGpp synthase/HD superfamily hydrolase